MVKCIGKVPKIIQDCSDVEDVCTEIFSHLGEAWDFEFPKSEVPNGYQEALERVIFILKVYLRLLLMFVGLSPGVQGAFPKHRSILMSDLSIPAFTYSLWMRIKFLVSESIKQETTLIVEKQQNEVSNHECQTNMLSLEDCENCEISKNIIRNLINKVEGLCLKNKINSFIGIIRQQLRPRIHEITAWAAMTFWYEAIMYDIDTISLRKKKERKKNHLRKSHLFDTICRLESQLGYGPQTAQVEEIKRLKRKVWKLKNNLAKKEEESKSISEKLEISEMSRKNIEEEAKIIRENFDADRENMKKLEIQITEKIEDVNLMIAKYEKDIDCCNRQIKLLELEKESKQIKIREQQLTIKQITKKLQETSQNENVLKNQLKIIQLTTDYKREEHALLLSQHQDASKSGQSSKKVNKTKKYMQTRKPLNENLAEMKEWKDPFLQYAGEVRIDTAMQKVDNEQKIKLLRSKNKKIKDTLNKLQDERNEEVECDLLQTKHELLLNNDSIA